LLSAQAQNFPENLLHKEEAQQVPEASGWACKFNYLEYAPLLTQRLETLNPKSLLLVCSNVVVTGAQLPFMIRDASHKAMWLQCPPWLVQACNIDWSDTRNMRGTMASILPNYKRTSTWVQRIGFIYDNILAGSSTAPANNLLLLELLLRTVAFYVLWPVQAPGCGMTTTLLNPPKVMDYPHVKWE
jgi:hypothetical protein